MVQINFGRKEVSCKIVYYGPGMSGKTTNLEVVHQKVPEQNRGELTSISTDGDRTLFFDYMPLELGSIAGMKTKFQLYTVPGQVYYNSTRKLVLQGADGIVFVADSHPDKMKENLESYRNLEENLREYGKDLQGLPHVIQCNKRDLPNAMPVEEVKKHLGNPEVPVFEATAATGQGVFPTLKALVALVLESVNKSGMRPPAAAPSPPPPPTAAPAAAPAIAGLQQRREFAGTRAAPEAPARPPAFTGNAPVLKPAAVAAPSRPGPLPHLMAEAPKPQLVKPEAKAASPAARVARSSVAPPRPAFRHHGQPRSRRSHGGGKNLAFAFVFAGLVLAAATGIVLLFVL